MKKIWKNLCACSLAVLCGVGFAGCKDKEDKDRDLDGDGIISEWETRFQGDAKFELEDDIVLGEVVRIGSVDDLKSINSKTDKLNYYFLEKDLDLEGQKLSINLGKSVFFGQGHVIKNFQLGDTAVELYELDDSGLSQMTTTHDKFVVKSLFYNGSGVYTLRLFMGMQSLDVEKSSTNAYHSISPFFNVPVISGVEVKGRIDINSKEVSGVNSKVEASLLYSGRTEVVSGGTFDDPTTNYIPNETYIENVVTEGVISINETKDGKLSVNAGSIASSLHANSQIINTTSTVQINGGISMNYNHIGGIVGHNLGFVSSSNFNGNITLNNKLNISSNREYVGGIVGFNDNYAEIKNCKTNASITFVNETMESAVRSNYYIGGIAGLNRKGIIELCESDANIELKNITAEVTHGTNRYVGGICGLNDKGVLSYLICRGTINATNVLELSVAQVAGHSIRGLFEKIITTTQIDVDNLQNDSVLKIGMVTTFNYGNSSDNSMLGLETSPYFSQILVDGVTTFRAKKEEDYNYKQGLRYDYKQLVGVGEDKNEIYDTFVPAIFDNLYYASTCKLIEKSENGESTVVPVTYCQGIGSSSATPNNLIQLLDFKNYFNHNQVSIGKEVNLKDLHFTITDDKFKAQSYFGESSYNGELSYFDKEFTESFKHDEGSSLGFCKYDGQDEMLSFLYYLMHTNNGKTQENYVIKVSDDYIGTDVSLESVGVKTPQTVSLIKKIKNMLSCLSVSGEMSVLDAKKDIVYTENPDKTKSSTAEARFVEFVLTDSTNKYKMTIDVSNLEADMQGNYILYLTFKAGE